MKRNLEITQNVSEAPPLRMGSQASSAAQLNAPYCFDAIVISDIHFGSRMCQARELEDFLSNIRVKHLILNGDVFDDLKFNRLQHWHWQALSRIRKDRKSTRLNSSH